jgi:hypothetical protein
MNHTIYHRGPLFEQRRRQRRSCYRMATRTQQRKQESKR